MMQRHIEGLVGMLEICASGSFIACTGIDKLAACELYDDADVMSACHALRHFLVDEDIRAKDPEYDQFQRARLAECARKLKAAFL